MDFPPTVVYALYDDGSIEKRAVSGDGSPELAKPGRFVDEAVYEAARDDMAARRDADVAAMLSAEQTVAKDAYTVLSALPGITPEMACYLARYEPSDSSDDS